MWHIQHCVLYTSTVHCPLQTGHSALLSVHYILLTVHLTLYAICIRPTKEHTLFTKNCLLNLPIHTHFKLQTIHYTQNIVKCTLYIQASHLGKNNRMHSVGSLRPSREKPTICLNSVVIASTF